MKFFLKNSFSNKRLCKGKFSLFTVINFSSTVKSSCLHFESGYGFNNETKMAMAAEEKVEDSDSDTSFLSELEEILNESKQESVRGLHFDETYFAKEVATIESNRNGCRNDFCNFSDSYKQWRAGNPQAEFSPQSWERFSDWVHCIAIVTFDLEIGQTIEMIYPEHAILSEQEKTSICYLAFPDSNSGCMGDTQFHFRVRQNAIKHPTGNADGPKCTRAVKSHLMYNQSCPAAFRTDPNYLWGFAYFRQVKDRSLKRGYFQKSLVLLTHLPFVELFRHVTALIAPEFFDKGVVCLESACKEIDQWPYPVPGERISLPLMGTVFHVYVMCSSIASPASATGSPQHSHMSRLRRYLIATDVDLFAALCPLLPHIQLLWELVLCGEPLVVMANSPSVCSQVVQALVTLIYPLQYCLDYRPFFTIHDAEFKEYTGTNSYPPSVLLGVTNPFFAKALQHWPHVIRMGDMPGSAGNSGGGFKVRLKKLANPKEDSKPGVYTTHKPYLQREKAVFKVIAKGVQTRRPSEVQSALLRRHFLELTQSFIIPLERYMARLMPLQKSISPYKAVPLLKPFKTDDFIASLDQCGPQLTTGVKGDWSGLYQHFFRSPNFDSWFQNRQKEANLKLHALQAEALSQSDMTSWLQGKREVEVVDMVLRLREKLDVVREDQLPVSPETMDQLEDQLKKVMEGLPEDLRSVLKSS